MTKIFKMKKFIACMLTLMLVSAVIGPYIAKADTTPAAPQPVVNLTGDAAAAKTAANQVALQILATSDSHGRFLPYDYAINSPNTLGSLAQISTAVNQFKSKNPDNTIIVDAGDIIQDNSASLFLNDKENPMVLAMNQIGYDTITLGNHEFNYGIPVLQKIMKQFKGTVLGGNVYYANGKRLAAPYAIVERSGVKVGIIGMVTPNITKWDASNLKGYKVTNPVDETKAAVEELKAKGADVIVAVQHMGETGEYGTAGSGALEVLDKCPGIDAFVAAHFHNKIAGDYFYNHYIYSLNTKTNAVTVAAADGTTKDGTMDAYNEAKAKGTVIVEPYKWGQSLSQINITVTKNADGKFEIANKATDITSAIYDMSNKATGTVDSDPNLVSKLQSYNKRAIDDANSPIGTLKDGNLAPDNEVKGIEQAKLQPTAMIELINRVQMKYGKMIAKHDIDVSSAAAFKDGQNIKEGQIKKCDTANIYQFDNTLYVLKITGSQLKKYMEWSANYYNKYNTGDLTVSFNKSIPGYNYDMFYGVKYQIDISKDPGSRITNLTKMDGTPIKDTDVLYMTVNNYRASTQLLSAGPVFKTGESLPTLVGKSEQTVGLGDGRVRDLIGRYIQESKDKTITPECSDNWSIIGNNWDKDQRAEAVKLINDGTISLAGIAGEQTSSNSKSVTWDDVQKAKGGK